MPSIVRFFLILVILAGLGFGGMVALAYLVEPTEREMEIRIPSDRINP